jgi:hypothetical protein
MSFLIPNADTLVTYLKNWTGSSNNDEIKQCIFQAELMMRNIELPALRSNPYDPAYCGIADANGSVPIPADMNKPILFFQQGNNGQQSSTGPWIVYDRIGDRDMISMNLVSQLYLAPVNVPAVIRGKFSEVGNTYEFLPRLTQGAIVNLYYYRAWDLLFTPIYNDDEEIVDTVQTNSVLETFPEGYVYGALTCYYVKRHSAEDAAMYQAKFEDAWNRVEDQNNKGKWNGGHTKLTSVFQPRRQGYWTYNQS